VSRAADSGETALRPYWERIATEWGAGDPLGAVCYPGMPVWFNRFHARSQVRAIERMLAGIELRGRRCLDVGCGSGRWTRWLAERGARASGVDPTAAMLEVARRAWPEGDLRQMSATRLEFEDGFFDLVTSVTVVQHLEPEEQAAAAAEMARVLRPGGDLLVLDLIDARDPGRIVFPRTPEGWIALYRAQGLSLQRWIGQDFAPLLRLPAALLSSERARGSATEVAAPTILERLAGSRLLQLALRPVIAASHPLELASERLLPPRWARHGCFLFEKAGRETVYFR